MTQRVVTLSLALAAVVSVAGSAWGLPPIRDQFTEMYGLEKKASCNVCHVKGEKKDKRNEYGEALSQLVRTNKKWTDIDAVKADFKANKDAAKAAVGELMKKLEGEKSKEGPTYGELIKAGKLPGME